MSWALLAELRRLMPKPGGVVIELPDTGPWKRIERIGNAVLLLGDCLEILPHLPKVDAVITSPPYDEMREYGGQPFDYKAAVAMVVPSITEGGVVCWNVADQTIDGSETGTSFRTALLFMESLRLHDTMIYEKPNFSNPSNNRYHQLFEYIFVLSNGAPKTFNPIKDKKNVWAGTGTFGVNTFRDANGSMQNRTRNIIEPYGMRGNVWHMNTAGQEQVCTAQPHPAAMPLRLAGDLLTSWTNKDDMAMDPFMGGGTTGIACHQLGRKFIGVEINELYFDIACRRIEDAQRQVKLFPEEQKDVGMPGVQGEIFSERKAC